MNSVFNRILCTGHFPKTWKRGKVITIPKTGKNPPLLSPVHEFGSGHSTTLQLIRVLHHFTSERTCERYMVAILLNMEKGFAGCDTTASFTSSSTPHCRLYLQQSSQASSNDVVFTLPSITHYPPPARYEQESRKITVYPLSHTRHTLIIYRRCGVTSRTGRTM
ncbi:hypothetical protein EVAR_24214_1 [Eumeta japonica]|uniref:Uncharacterized protein n=1 Tax=Eumeta variegata TaxID=151549 RepID=A0A4C1W4P0_EUMVA|nr:hypothetical protein EVAR_24214_1 [Eumeta japonica]